MDQIKEEIGKGKTDRVWRNILSNAMQPVLETAKTLAPKDTGQLEDHIYLKVHKPQSRDKASKYYDGEMYMARVTAGVKREDTHYKFVVNKRGRLQTVVTNKKPVALSQEFGNSHTPSHPFLRPALELNYDKVISRLDQGLRIFIESYDRKK